MLEIVFKDGSKKEFSESIEVREIFRKLGVKNACAGKLDKKLVDLRTQVNFDCKLEPVYFDSLEGKKVYWHTASHILAQAVKNEFKYSKLAIGPAIDNGFYYDFDLKSNLNKEDLSKLENEVNKIIKENLKIERFVMKYDEAVKFFEEKNENYKLEILSENLNKEEHVSFYKQGEFAELCSGPHLLSTGEVGCIKLLNSTGAYWRGNSKNKMLKRIYGISFQNKKQLKEYLENLEEAKKRDHNKLGRELEFFTTVDYIGQGLPILMPKGTKVMQILQRFVEDEEEKRGYLLTKTPLLAKKDLYEISGHWDHYRDGMFVINSDDKNKDVLALRPMTCPFQFQVYLNRSRSYRDLPMKLNETSTLFRNEASGEMHGLIRVRQFTLSEGHIACTPEQLEKEFTDCLDLANFMLEKLGLKDDVFYRLSKWDENNKEKYIGDSEEWENVQNKMRDILDKFDLKYEEVDGEAAFYGPKLDIQIKNVHGKEDTLITIQIDFQLAKRFDMQYVDINNQRQYPYVIHRTSLGCYERTLALLIEKYAGALPLWLSPEQVRILILNESLYEKSKKLKLKLGENKIRVFIDNRNEKIGYKIRQAQLDKIPYMLILGEKELEKNSISVRHREKGDLKSMKIEEFINLINKELSC
ncbi:MAG: threonine--tRNA ligase [Candidatus Paraimprobicoccus trichonymphae]|uniref:Threonine--tRNA ligase n=1 Tax=Candidatus Paraimprobicoccus trichonymphae TaxID=3033793 RepID=A0AA48I033_9FIRM|nr:MAG: threonine--tRNA ligase [Candidatus Paraimprobicoccus trichonymphae]